MKNNDFHKGITLTALGSFWWGVIGVIYFEYISFVGHIEVVLHRCIWTAFFLLITTSFFSKWPIFLITIKNYKVLITLFFFRVLNFYKLGCLDLCCNK
ncbi:hypothetical protein OAD13_00870 [Candidatus Pelagibacter sp.]|nr:hypothetical protein [Candidatus Pelagibacter sp.]